jgi:hypothetical protein
MKHWGAFFRALPWAELVPDLDQTFATAGLGESRGLDTVTAAVTGDGHLAVAYLPLQRALTINPARLSGPHLTIGWFQPATGRRVDGGELTERGLAVLEAPFTEDSVPTLTSSG